MIGLTTQSATTVYYQQMKSSKTRLDELNAQQIKRKVKFTHFEHKDTLDPKIFKADKTMVSKVRNKILEIADLFIDSLEVKSLKVKDVVLTGSLANYNWSPFSDVDIHVIVDTSKSNVHKDLLADYFSLKKEAFKKNHSEMNIFGYDVELYAQDIKEEHNSSGQYSVLKNKWVVEPEPFTEEDEFDETNVLEKSSLITDEIDFIENAIGNTNNKRDLRKLETRLSSLLKKLKDQRKKGLEKDGEYNDDNIIYKVVRRTDYLEKIFNIRNRIIDKIYSLDGE